LKDSAEPDFCVKKALFNSEIKKLDYTLVVSTPFGLRLGDQIFSSIEDLLKRLSRVN
jgi:hypothetical protein